jgi:5-keto 4-deoxyuronate isomerase
MEYQRQRQGISTKFYHFILLICHPESEIQFESEKECPDRFYYSCYSAHEASYNLIFCLVEMMSYSPSRDC